MLSGQMFGEDGPARALVQTAEALLGEATAKVEAAAPPAPKPPKPKPARAKIDERQPMLF
jgi:hypothetical protein